MGQYWMVVNLDKRECVHPHRLGAGMKLWEQVAAHPGTGAALIVLCAAMPTPRGGGDLDLDENWHGPERQFPEHNMGPGPMPHDYPSVAQSVIGRWAGDRIALVGDYAEDSDLALAHHAASIYGVCHDHDDGCDIPADAHYRDISDRVARVIEHELCGTFTGDGWRKFVPFSGAAATPHEDRT